MRCKQWPLLQVLRCFVQQEAHVPLTVLSSRPCRLNNPFQFANWLAPTMLPGILWNHARREKEFTLAGSLSLYFVHDDAVEVANVLYPVVWQRISFITGITTSFSLSPLWDMPVF